MLPPFTPFRLDGIKERGSVGEGCELGTGEAGRIVINQETQSGVGEICRIFLAIFSPLLSGKSSLRCPDEQGIWWRYQPNSCQ